MSSSSTNDSFSIFQDGKLKPGVYRIQNVESETYLDFHLRSMELCCRPPKDLERERGFVCVFTSAIRSSDSWEVGNQEPWGGIRDMEGELVDATDPFSVIVD